jgi:pimeloyl-ACP methyl ester carboxylesterase
MTNAVRGDGGFRWRLNVDALERQTVAADLERSAGTFDGEALLVACGRSSSIVTGDHAIMRARFPNARIETIPGADHWPNVTAPDALARLLKAFLDRAGGGASPDDAINPPPSRH